MWRWYNWDALVSTRLSLAFLLHTQKNKFQARQQWRMLLIPARGRQRLAGLWVWGQPGPQSKFQNSQSYAEKPCLEKQKKKFQIEFKHKQATTLGKLEDHADGVSVTKWQKLPVTPIFDKWEEKLTGISKYMPDLMCFSKAHLMSSWSLAECH